MKIKFWGVRGSVPSTFRADDLRRRLQEVLALALEHGLEAERIDEFMSSLSPRVTGLVGGNTPCLEITEGEDRLIIDAGTGIIDLGLILAEGLDPPPLPHADFEVAKTQASKPLVLNILFTHTHWDHIQGLPFFKPIYQLENTINIYGLNKLDLIEALTIQQQSPKLFPVSLERSGACLNFYSFPHHGLKIGPFDIKCLAMPHPGGSLAFKIKTRSGTVVFATDYELLEADNFSCLCRPQLALFIQFADVFISDTQYTYLESMAKEGWGHSNPLKVVEMALAAGVKNFFHFHHDPFYSDSKLYDMLDKTIAYTKLLYPDSTMTIALATEGQEIEI
ncbi:MAG: MBL fold metallo-hydrolase [Deltaproteobacteria bacterium]|jgi:phosphoribosyl 1,2-cyclic phosphodiesterase|nr:MBL fold metallo-hydrolase [Deltaproteobacteria bacterium]